MLFADSPIFNVQIFQDKTSREDGVCPLSSKEIKRKRGSSLYFAYSTGTISSSEPAESLRNCRKISAQIAQDISSRFSTVP